MSIFEFIDPLIIIIDEFCINGITITVLSYGKLTRPLNLIPWCIALGSLIYKQLSNSLGQFKVKLSLLCSLIQRPQLIITYS